MGVGEVDPVREVVFGRQVVTLAVVAFGVGEHEVVPKVHRIA